MKNMGLVYAVVVCAVPRCRITLNTKRFFDCVHVVGIQCILCSSLWPEIKPGILVLC